MSDQEKKAVADFVQWLRANNVCLMVPKSERGFGNYHNYADTLAAEYIRCATTGEKPFWYNRERDGTETDKKLAALMDRRRRNKK